MVIFQLGQQYKVEHLGINKGTTLPFFVSANHSPGKSSKFHLKSWGNITSNFGEICMRQINLDIYFYILKYIIVFHKLPYPLHIQILGELLKQEVRVHQVYKKETRPSAFPLLCGPTTEITISESLQVESCLHVSAEADVPLSKFYIISDFLLLGLS